MLGGMSFERPEWIALLPVLALAGWMWRGLAMHRPLRACILLISVLLLMGPRVSRFSGGMDLWVLLDRSDSVSGRVELGWPEWRQLLEQGKKHSSDRVRVVDFAADAVSQELNAGGPFTGNRGLTRAGHAVRTALALRDPERASRILVFTDGWSTEPAENVADQLGRAGVPLDLRLLPDPPGTDLRLRRLQMPATAQVAEPFLIEVEVAGNAPDGPVPLTIFRNGRKLADSAVTLENGRGVARFTDRVAVSGAFHYEAVISPENDSRPGNNRYEAWIEVTGGPRLLLVTAYVDDPVERVLAAQGFAVETVRDAKTLHVGRLSGCRGVILNNVPAWDLPPEFLASLNFFVNGQGGGLLMAGGQKSFGAGGYFQSAVDELLPVSMELKKDQRKLKTAMAIVMDRSGSMSASAGGITKMDLANEGAARAVELLGAQDEIAVFAVDSEAHEFVPMQPIGSDGNRSAITNRVRRIVSKGGGIYVFNGLLAGWKALQTSTSGTRHLILFADAADAEQPDDYVTLLETMTANGATVSVIALGRESDADANFLKDVARRGNGRIFFTDRPEDLPNVFTAEAVAVARSSFIKEPVPVAATGQWFEISGKSLSWLEEVDGYNLSYKKDWAAQALISGDEYAAPLVAWGLRGAGRSAAVSFPLGGEYSALARAWPQYGDFLQTLTRWLMGENVPPGLGVRAEVNGTRLTVDLLYSEEFTEKFAESAPRVVMARGMRAESMPELPWERLAPGHYRAVADLTDGSVVRGAVWAAGHALPFGPLSVGTDAEWSRDPRRVEELRRASTQSGGRELLDLKDAWQSPPVSGFTDLRGWLLPLLLGLFLSEALVTRMGWRLPEFGAPRFLKKRRLVRNARASGKAGTPDVPETSAQTIPEAPAGEEEKSGAAAGDKPSASVAENSTPLSRKERFARAKRNF